jgi:hypothetical protein
MADESGLIVGGQGTDDDRRVAAEALSGNFPGSKAWANSQTFYPNLPVNPAAWDAAVASWPESTNIEDRRNEPPASSGPRDFLSKFLPQTPAPPVGKFDYASGGLRGFLPQRFEPVEHNPFDPQLVPVEHNPFAAPVVTPVGLMRPTPNAPVMTPDERLRWNEQEMQRELRRPGKGEEELNKSIPPRPSDQWASTPGHFANVRYNNPGAMYPGAAARRFGSTGTGTIGGGHLIANFPTPVHGAAANMENVTAGGYVGMPLGSAIFKWSGGGRNAVPGYDPRQVITPQMARDPNFMIPFMKAVASGEAPGRYPMSDEQWRQAFDWYVAGGNAGEAAKPFDIASVGGRPRLIPVDHNPFAVSTPQPPTNTQGLATALFNRYAPQRAPSLAQYMPEGARQYYVE